MSGGFFPSLCRYVVVLIIFIHLAGCASTSVQPNSASLYNEPSPPDPFEGFNRFIYDFNRDLDRLTLRPLAEAYDLFIPKMMHEGIGHMLSLSTSPIIIGNHILQGKWEQAGHMFTRSFLNLTLGIGGFFDIATSLGYPHQSEDFGQTLALWGIDSGPYLMLPLLGPTTFRDLLGRGGDLMMDPKLYLLTLNDDVPGFVSTSIFALDTVDKRHSFLGQADMIHRTSVDPYAALRELYYQNRLREIRDGAFDPMSLPDIPDFSEFSEENE